MARSFYFLVEEYSIYVFGDEFLAMKFCRNACCHDEYYCIGDCCRIDDNVFACLNELCYDGWRCRILFSLMSVV